MKIGLITSNHLRHKYFVKKIINNFNVDICIFESKPRSSKSLKNVEFKYFSDLKNYKFNLNQIILQGDDVNSDKVRMDLVEYELDYIFTFGCSLLSYKIFEIPSKKCINIHTGLVQHYRGVDSSMWAAYDNRFDLIGSTIHEVDSSIDGGKILFQRKIKMTALKQAESIDDLFVLTCIHGIDLLISKLDEILYMKTKNIDFKSIGKLYQNKDRNDDVIKRAEKNLLRLKK